MSTSKMNIPKIINASGSTPRSERTDCTCDAAYTVEKEGCFRWQELCEDAYGYSRYDGRITATRRAGRRRSHGDLQEVNHDKTAILAIRWDRPDDRIPRPSRYSPHPSHTWTWPGWTAGWPKSACTPFHY